MMRKRVAVVAAVVMLTLAACGSGTGQGHGSRDRLYGSVEELAADSVAVAVVTVEGREEFAASTVGDEGRGAYSAFDATVVDVASPSRLGTAVSDDLKAAVAPPAVGDRIVVRMLGTAEQPGPTQFLRTGEAYLLFLTATGLPESPAHEFYIVGGSAGVYRAAGDGIVPGADFTKDGVENEGDELPKDVTLAELRG